jgi:hypothetical protein
MGAAIGRKGRSRTPVSDRGGECPKSFPERDFANAELKALGEAR